MGWACACVCVHMRALRCSHRLLWHDGRKDTTTSQAQRQGLAQAIMGEHPAVFPDPFSFPASSSWPTSAAAKTALKKCYVNVGDGGTLAWTSSVSLPAKVDLSDAAGVSCLHHLTTLVIPHEENKTTFQTEEGCPLVKMLSM